MNWQGLYTEANFYVPVRSAPAGPLPEPYVYGAPTEFILGYCWSCKEYLMEYNFNPVMTTYGLPYGSACRFCEEKLKKK